MKKTRFKSIDITISKEYRVICIERDYRGKWTTNFEDALEEVIKHQNETNQTHEVKVEERVISITHYTAPQFLMLK